MKRDAQFEAVHSRRGECADATGVLRSVATANAFFALIGTALTARATRPAPKRRPGSADRRHSPFGPIRPQLGSHSWLNAGRTRGPVDLHDDRYTRLFSAPFGRTAPSRSRQRRQGPGQRSNCRSACDASRGAGAARARGHDLQRRRASLISLSGRSCHGCRTLVRR